MRRLAEAIAALPLAHREALLLHEESGLSVPGIAEAGASRDLAVPAAETLERRLERIAALRAEGRHEEADMLLAAFRERHPGYRIPEAMRLRVERSGAGGASAFQLLPLACSNTAAVSSLPSEARRPVWNWLRTSAAIGAGRSTSLASSVE